MKRKVLFLTSILLLLAFGERTVAQKRMKITDKIVIVGDTLRLTKNISIENHFDFLSEKYDSLVDDEKRIMIGRNYYSLWVLKNDSLFLREVTLLSNDKNKRKEFRENFLGNGKGDYFFSVFDTLQIDYGSILRQEYECLVYEFQRRLNVENGIVKQNIVFNNIITDPNKLPRKTEILIFNRLKNSIEKKMDYETLRQEYGKKIKYITQELSFRINKEGKIDSVSTSTFEYPLYSQLKNILLSLDNWELRQKYGKPIEEEFHLSIQVDLKSYLVTGVIDFNCDVK